MRNFRRRALTALAVVAGTVAVAEPAAAITLGPPIPAENPNISVDASSARLEMVAPDPIGGLPWAAVSYRATSTGGPVPGRALACTIVGRTFLGKVGELHEGGVFRPYEPGAGQIACGGTTPGFEHERAGGSTFGKRAALVTDPPCWDGCPPENTRQVGQGIEGHGVYAAWAERADGTWRPLPVSARGGWLAVSEATTSGRVKLRATLCGPLARPDLQTRPGAVVDGCTLTWVMPPQFPPFPGVPGTPGTPTPVPTPEG